MKQWRFEVFNKPGFSDVHGKSVLEDIEELGIKSVQAVQSAKVFLVEADFDRRFADQMAKELLSESSPEEKLEKNSDLMQAIYKRNLKTLQELSEMIKKSNTQSGDVINKRIADSIQIHKTRATTSQ